MINIIKLHYLRTPILKMLEYLISKRKWLRFPMKFWDLRKMIGLLIKMIYL